jgi:hypothetical protein
MNRCASKNVKQQCLKPIPARDLVVIFELLADYGKRFLSHAGQVLRSRYCDVAQKIAFI